MNCRQAHLTIADVVFSSFYEEELSIEIEEENGSVYSPFVTGKPPLEASFNSAVRIAYIGEGPNIEEAKGWSHLFEGDQSWALFQKNKDFRFSFHSPDSGQSNLTATCRNNFRQIDIECGPFYLMRDRTPAILSNPLRYPLDQLLMIHILAREGGVLLHAAGVEYQARAYLFAGASGAGKSTIAGLLGGAPGIEAVNDDRIVVRKKEGFGYRAYGTPWPGEKRISRNQCLPLRGIFFIAKSGGGNKIRPLSASEALKSMFPVASIPWYHREMAAGVMDFCGGLVRDVGMYEFAFRADESAADCFLAHTAAQRRPN